MRDTFSLLALQNAVRYGKLSGHAHGYMRREVGYLHKFPFMEDALVRLMNRIATDGATRTGSLHAVRWEGLRGEAVLFSIMANV